MARVMLDVDDVLYPCVDAIRQYLVDRKGFHPGDLVTPSTWDLHKHWDLDYDTLWGYVNDGIKEKYIFTVGLPMSGVNKGIDDLRKAGHSIHLVTARRGYRKDVVKKRTLGWLKDHDIHYDSITFSEDKTVVKADFALDDRLENYHALTETCEAFLMNQPWNTSDRTAQRVSNFEQFVSGILGREKASYWVKPEKPFKQNGASSSEAA